VDAFRPAGSLRCERPKAKLYVPDEVLLAQHTNSHAAARLTNVERPKRCSLQVRAAASRESGWGRGCRILLTMPPR
jgi:hypothetical protein